VLRRPVEFAPRSPEPILEGFTDAARPRHFERVARPGEWPVSDSLSDTSRARAAPSIGVASEVVEYPPLRLCGVWRSVTIVYGGSRA
jgi:hypothetical protein